MAETKTEATVTAGTTASASAPDATTGGLVADLAHVDPKALQSYVDKQVRQALKTREDNLAAEKAAELKKKEQEAMKAAGDFERLQKQLEADRDAALARANAQHVSYELKLAALAAGINDANDVRLLPDDVMASLMDERGAVNRDAVAKAVESLKTSKGYLFKQPASTHSAAPPAFAGAPSPGAAVPAAPSTDATAESILKARIQYGQRVRAPRPA